MFEEQCFPAVVVVNLLNYYDFTTSKSPLSCTIYYDLEGDATSKDYPAPNYMGWLLGATLDGAEDDCETMAAVFGHEILSSDFGAPFPKLGFALQPFSEVTDAQTLADWENTWPAYEKTYGSWEDMKENAAALTIDMPEFTSSTPIAVDIVFGYEIDPISLEIVGDGSGAVPRLDLSASPTLPTAYYESVPMYVLSTGIF